MSKAKVYKFEIDGVSYIAEDDGEMFIRLYEYSRDKGEAHPIGYIDWLRTGCGLGKIKASVRKGFKAERQRWLDRINAGHDRQVQRALTFANTHRDMLVEYDTGPCRLIDVPIEDRMYIARQLVKDQYAGTELTY